MDAGLLLQACGIDPASVAYCLHKPADARTRLAVLAMAETEPELFDAYQSTHAKTPEATLKARRVQASCISRGDSTQVFVGLSHQAGWRDVPAAELDALPAFRAMHERIGYPGFVASGIDRRALFTLVPMPELADLRGRLVVADPGTRTYMRWAEGTPLSVIEITRAPDLVPPLPDWRTLALDAATIRALPRAWAETLRHWRGIYLIVDESDGGRYVGAACGAENLLGRWRAHVAQERGVTAKLRNRDPARFRFSILERVAPDASADEVIARETGWKHRLHSLAHGLNRQ